MLSKYNSTNRKRIWYYTDDISKFNNDITDKEHQIEGAPGNNWLQEVKINNKGDIIPSKTISNNTYKDSYYWGNESTTILTTFIGGESNLGGNCGLFAIAAIYTSNFIEYDAGFVKVTILDD